MKTPMLKRLNLWDLNQMIVSSFESENRHANVCLQDKEWVVMCYENNEFVQEHVALNEQSAEDKAENWVSYEPI